MWSVIFVSFFVVSVINCDVLHLLTPTILLDPPEYNIHHVGDYNYVENEVPIEPILPPSTEVPFTLPEIIINKSAEKSENKSSVNYSFNGYNYAKPNVTFDIPIQSDDIGNDDVDNEYVPPDRVSTTETANAYLPPLAPNHRQNTKKKERGRNYNYYNYVKPSASPPIQFDEPFLEPSYLPPVIGPPLNTYLPPQTQFRTLLNRTDNDFFQIAQNNRSPLRLELTTLKCLQNGGNGFFQSKLTVQSFLDSKPVFEDALNCNKLGVVRNQIVIEIDSGNFENCGVTTCGQNQDEMCLRVRFPQIRTMKTINDPILVLQCKPQERVVSKTHLLKMGIAADSQARSSSTIAQGGTDAKFRTQIGIFRRTGDSFTRSLEPNGVVQLGEDLMLRTQARQGDGWNYTKISGIAMQRIGLKGEILNSINLVSNSGCLNPAMRSICPLLPVFEPPMGHRFGFKAVMFQGMKSGDELVMTVRMVGCVNLLDCQQDVCDLTKPRTRIRRGSNDDSFSETASISFRVQANDVEEPKSVEYSGLFIWSCIGMALGIVGLAIFCVMATFYYRNKYF